MYAIRSYYDEYKELFNYAKEIGISMFSTAFDLPSADFLAKLDVPAFKIASGDLKSIPLLTYIAKFQKPMIVSTGGGIVSLRIMYAIRSYYDSSKHPG